MVLAALKPCAKNVSGVGIDELFLQAPHSIGMTARAPHQSRGWFALFRMLDSVLRLVEPLSPKKLRAYAIDRAVAFIEQRLNGEDGLGAIYPAMANSVMMFDALGYSPEHPDRMIARLSDALRTRPHGRVRAWLRRLGAMTAEAGAAQYDTVGTYADEAAE